MTVQKLILKSLRRIHRLCFGYHWRNDTRTSITEQEANDLIREKILSSPQGGLMVSRFGTVELDNLCCWLQMKKGSYTIRDYHNYICDKGELFYDDSIRMLCFNAGFFPESYELWNKWAELVMNDLRFIDILGSYINNEDYIEEELSHSIKISLSSIMNPFLYDKPWSSALKDKKVMIIHPFTESIKQQYEKRDKLFSSPDILPEFRELILVKAVQSIAGNGANTGFNDWFEALYSMEKEIESYDYDIALIGCGAYGMNLAAYIKRQGKIAIHMASAVQVLFGIYGNRHINSEFINEYWVRPNENEKPSGADKIENGCYW